MEAHLRSSCTCASSQIFPTPNHQQQSILEIMSSEHPQIVGTLPPSAAAPAVANGSSAVPLEKRSASHHQPTSFKAETTTSNNLGTFGVKSGLAQMLKGGVIMDVVNVEQARIAEEAGACAVMALERVPADIRVEGGVARMSDPGMIKEIIEAVSVSVIPS